MDVADLINGTFELVGSLALWWNVRQAYKDKAVRGVTRAATAVFMLWGFWNLYYYPSLNQWWSFLGGLSIAAANAFWLFLLIRYWKTGRKVEFQSTF